MKINPITELKKPKYPVLLAAAAATAALASCQQRTDVMMGVYASNPPIPDKSMQEGVKPAETPAPRKEQIVWGTPPPGTPLAPEPTDPLPPNCHI